MKTDLLILEGLDDGDKLRFVRLAKGLRQVDLASIAKVQVPDIVALEKNRRYVSIAKRRRIFEALGLEWEEVEWPPKPQKPRHT